MNKNNGKSSAHHGVDILKYKGFIGTSQYCDSENAFYGKTLNTEKPVIYIRTDARRALRKLLRRRRISSYFSFTGKEIIPF